MIGAPAAGGATSLSAGGRPPAAKCRGRSPDNGHRAPEDPVASEDELAEAFQQLTHSDAEQEIDVPVMPVEQAIGREDLTRLRARYAELLARIAERGGDAARIDALRAEAEALNPDAWVTEEETRLGIAAFEPKLQELRAALGLRRRRRSRRGGRRRQWSRAAAEQRGVTLFPSALSRYTQVRFFNQVFNHDQQESCALGSWRVFSPCSRCLVSRPARSSRQLRHLHPQPTGSTPTFRTAVNLVSSDVIVRNRRGQFQADLTKDDFELYEDGVKQELSSFVLVHGGRVFQTQTATAAPVREGIILPPSRPVNDTAGRIIIFVIDDLHMDVRRHAPRAQAVPRHGQRAGPRRRSLRHRIDGHVVHCDRPHLRQNAHGGSGEQDYGRRVEAVRDHPAVGHGRDPQEVMHRANVAFETIGQMLTNLEQAQNRRKAVVAHQQRLRLRPVRRVPHGHAGPRVPEQPESSDPNDPKQCIRLFNQGNQFNDAELSMRLSEITRQANRANATFYTFDPRGLVAGQDIDEPVDLVEWEYAPAEAAGQPARDGRADGRRRRGQHERLQQGAEAD